MSNTTTKFEKNKTLFLVCDCRSEVLSIEYDHEIKMADFAIFRHEMSHKYINSIWQRLRYAFRVLLGHNPYADQMMLTKEQLKDLRFFLESLPK